LITRFAPAPTGWLHLGHVLNADFVWRRGAELNGQVLLRIEDHDRSRSRKEFEIGILGDLDWLGYRPHIYPTDAYRAGRCDGRQSDRDLLYFDAFELLREQDLVYACDCSRRVAAQLAPAPLPSGSEAAERRYTGECRDKGHPLADGYGWRLRIEPGIEEFYDERLGRQRQNPAEQCGDVLLRDRLGNWTYQFAVTVDDWRQNVDYVIRGIDLLASTGRQIRMARLLGRTTPPTFVHHPLIMKSAAQKLSKSDGDTGVRELRAKGWSAEAVIEHARRLVD
jgi:glutamyl-tRNA synthetase/glutamyl-Q tRNA(Asp) synthetase